MKKIALLMVLILVLIPLSCLAASGVDGSTGCGGGGASSGSGGGGGGGSNGRFLTSFSATAELDEGAGKIYVSVNLGQAVDSRQERVEPTAYPDILTGRQSAAPLFYQTEGLSTLSGISNSGHPCAPAAISYLSKHITIFLSDVI